MKRKTKNAFTLIELLAVIVILAIIALIATPIILGIVEDARRDAFLRSVELVISSTDLDVMNKLTDTGYEYELVDGKISDEKTLVGYEISENCETNLSQIGYPTETAISVCNNEAIFGGLTLTEFVVQNPTEASAFVGSGVIVATYTYNDLNLAKNTEGMNGIISYNASGKEVYAIHNGTYCVTKKLNLEKAEVSDYVEGECNSNITMTFPEFINVSAGGDKAISGDGQLINAGKYGIRYQGKNPNNYVYFNCSDYNNPTADTCEVWRIIGVVDGKVKIISTKTEEKSWNDQGGNGHDITDINDWNNSTLKTYLNGDYYNSLLAKNSENENMISPSTWYLRHYDVNIDPNIGPNRTLAYDMERTIGDVLYETPYIENTKIGLMYLSDYAFAAVESASCSINTSLYFYNNGCKGSNWLTDQTIGDYEWIISTHNGARNQGFLIIHNDFDQTLNGNFSLATSRLIRPVLHLSSNVKIEGEGTENSPFTLQRMEG